MTVMGADVSAAASGAAIESSASEVKKTVFMTALLMP
jgi:hypothetical protein